MSEFEQNLCCGSESEEANLASLKETLALPGLRPVDVKRALCLYALRYGRSSKLNPREVQIVAESKSTCFGKCSPLHDTTKSGSKIYWVGNAFIPKGEFDKIQVRLVRHDLLNIFECPRFISLSACK